MDKPLTAHQYLLIQHKGDTLGKLMARAVRRIRSESGLSESSVTRIVIAAYEMAHYEELQGDSH